MTSTENSGLKPLYWVLLLVGVWLSLTGFATLWSTRVATNWPTVEGNVQESDVVNENDYCYVRIQYAYSVKGSDYRSDVVYFDPGIGGISISAETMGSEDQKEAEAIRDELSVGKQVTVYYSPKNPARSALRFDQGGGLAMGIMGSVLTLFGVLPLFSPGIFQSNRERVADDSVQRSSQRQFVLAAQELSQAATTSSEASLDHGQVSGSLIDSSVYELKHWRPGERVHFLRRGRRWLFRQPAYNVVLDWQNGLLRVGPEGSEETMPLHSIQELRIQGKHEIRSTGGGRNRDSERHDFWDAWLDAIVGSRRVRLASRSNFGHPDAAYDASLGLAAPLAAALGVSVRWAGFQDHPKYYPPQNVGPTTVSENASSNASNVDTAISRPSSAAGQMREFTTLPQGQMASRGDQAGLQEAPPETKITASQTTEGIRFTIPRGRLFGSGKSFAIGLLCGLWAALLTPAAWRDPALGPRLYVGLMWLIPIICIVFEICRSARGGTIAISGDQLAVTVRGWVRAKERTWSIRRDVLTVCVLPTGKEQEGLPVEELAVIGTDGSNGGFFPNRSGRELAWMAQSLRHAAGLPEPPAVTQPDPDMAVLEIARGLMAGSHREMEDQLALMCQADREIAEAAADAKGSRDAYRLTSISELAESTVATAHAKLSRSKIDAARAEFGLIEFISWRPGKLIRFRREIADAKRLASTAFYSGLGSGLVIVVAAPFLIPILGAALTVPIDIMRLKRLHMVLADLMAFGPGLIPWIVTLTILSMVWVYLKLSAAFAPREVQLDWQRRRLSVSTRHDEESIDLNDVRSIVIHEVKRSNQKGRDKHVARMEAQLARRNVILLETDESEEIDGMPEPPMSPQERLQVLGGDIAHHLRVPVTLADSVVDDFDVVGYPRAAKLRHFSRIWRNVSVSCKLAVASILLLLLIYWGSRAVLSYQEHANLEALNNLLSGPADCEPI